MRQNKGITLIETLIVITSLTVFVGISAGVYIAFLKSGYVDVSTREMQSILNLARVQTISSQGSQSFGVHLDPVNNEYTLFAGISYNSADSSNKVFHINPNVVVSSIDINGGGDDIVFTRLTGTTDQYGSVTLQDANNFSLSSQLCVSGTGNVETKKICAGDPLEYTAGAIDASLANFPSNSGDGDPAQSFTTGVDVYARAVDLYIKKASSDPSDVFLEIREGNTTGNVLGRSWPIDSFGLGSNYEWVRFVFPRPVFIGLGSSYFVRLRSFPDSAVVSSGAEGLIHWGYEHAASAPPAYALGDAWRYVNQGNIPTYQGQQMGPIDQYDFSFKVLDGIGPPLNTDSRHVDLDLEDLTGKGWSIQGGTTLRLEFSNPGFPNTVEDVSMVCCFNASSTVFEWQGNVDVNGDTETLRIHTRYLDGNDTVLSVHRDRRDNSKALDIYIDGKDIISYTANGTTTVGAYGGNMTHR